MTIDKALSTISEFMSGDIAVEVRNLDSSVVHTWTDDFHSAIMLLESYRVQDWVDEYTYHPREVI